jgi:DNA-binding protein HU-beta
MNKTDLIAEMAKHAAMTKTDANKALDAFIAAISDAMKKDQKVQLVGFGTFMTRKREATTGRNPKTGAEIKIPAKTLPVFKAGKMLRDITNK